MVYKFQKGVEEMSVLNLRDYLDQNEKSIRNLSKKTGIARSTIHRLLVDDEKLDIKLSTLLILANYFNCKVEDLISKEAYLRKGENHEINEENKSCATNHALPGLQTIRV